jgi:hypothetical protein
VIGMRKEATSMTTMGRGLMIKMYLLTGLAFLLIHSTNISTPMNPDKLVMEVVARVADDGGQN